MGLAALRRVAVAPGPLTQYGPRVLFEQIALTSAEVARRSSQYPGGVALRFARLVRYRDDKTAAEADTIDAVRAIAIGAGVLPATM